MFGNGWVTLRGINPSAMADMPPPVEVLIAEFVRCVVIAYVLARFVVRLGVVDWRGALQLGAWVWIGFQATAVIGSVRLESRGQKRSQPKLSHFPYGRVEPRGHDCPHTDDVAGFDDNAEWEKAFET